MTYTKAYMDIRPVTNKRFTKASTPRTMKLYKPMFSNKIVYVIS